MACVALYFGIITFFKLGDPWNIIGTAQFCVFVPIAVLFIVLVRRTRVLRVGHVPRESYREELAAAAREDAARGEELPKVRQDSASRPAAVRQRSTTAARPARARAEPASNNKAEDQSPAIPLDGQMIFATSEQAWQQALKQIPRTAIPDPRRDRNYLSLVHYAAEGGHAAALMKLAEIAFARKKNVEAYFWASVAKKCGLTEGVDPLLRQIRRAWQVGGMHREHKNVTVHFTEDRGKIGRSLLRIACGVKVIESRSRLRKLANGGDPDAALFV